MTGWLLAAAAVLAAAALGRQAGRAARADWGAPWLDRLDGLNRLFCRHVHGLRAPLLALPPEGPALVAANHVSGLDPLVLAAVSPRPLRFLIAREQYARWWLRPFFRAIGCIPVDRAHRPDRALRAALRALEAGEVVVIFPEGGIRYRTERRRGLKGGVAWLACRTGAPVLPVRVDGVRGAGRVLGALFLPSRVRVTAYPPLRCAAPEEGPRLLARLHDLLC
ncbi:lysophospholipid acyltransferase family protein [Inmirania thermothiophila]|uniref:1-acyl-sn-glycerol-3-phosphate acyltransferase n=1 Tax=Inmirania thermothiophila TaxID=1750597 RepID=A0A3N1Y7I1_9GAMM|nr:lysophospholipid acyltransferase family protein [Inmirania thermothiophila]ROR34710.1 1-acyl-sn-glycerol-3-phosphate acyltransferase [Inmirania thermothiophila]